ncbi:MAG: hypothetical protein ABSA09_03445 [Desulfobaccales bacterium]|jgi:hypothetical protein
MTLQQWANNGWLTPHTTSAQEIANLLTIVDRDLADAAGEISTDARFGIAYNGALTLCMMLLYAAGYRAAKGGHEHYRPIQALPFILGAKYKSEAVYLEACRKKRHIVEYDSAGVATEDDVEELVVAVQALRGEVLAWLKKHHPQLLST